MNQYEDIIQLNFEVIKRILSYRCKEAPSHSKRKKIYAQKKPQPCEREITFTTMIAITPQTMRNKKAMIHLSVATWNDEE